MATISFLIDNFDDNSLDTNLWDTAGSPGVSETGGRLTLTDLTGGGLQASGVYPKRFFNLHKGILALKMSKTGTTHSQVFVSIGVKDASGNYFEMHGQSSTATISRTSSGVTAGTATVVDTTVGLGPTWTADTWIGFYYNDSDNTIRLAKSTDGVIWTQIVRTIITASSLVWGDCGIFLEVENNTSPASNSNLVVSYNDYTYFALNDAFFKNRVRVGGAWILGQPKVRVSGAWVPVRSKVRDAGVWKEPV
jgi:hypothetical protein